MRLIAHTKKWIPAEIVDKKVKGKTLYYKLRWSNLCYYTNSYGVHRYPEKWVKADKVVVKVLKQKRNKSLLVDFINKIKSLIK